MSSAEQLHALLLIAAAMGLGGLVGLERDRAHRPAGVRTNMLVAGASALVIILGAAALEAAGGTTGDASRALHAIITGIGFLGGGMIMRDDSLGRTSGLTSAASVLIVAALGAACGMGDLILASGVTVLVLLTLRTVKTVQSKLPHNNEDNDAGC